MGEAEAGDLRQKQNQTCARWGARSVKWMTFTGAGLLT